MVGVSPVVLWPSTLHETLDVGIAVFVIRQLTKHQQQSRTDVVLSMLSIVKQLLADRSLSWTLSLLESRKTGKRATSTGNNRP
jgi:hypothetical protein